jgi:hypothetical protein
LDTHFGYNCTHFVPSLGKCRVMIERYNKRADLLAEKWLKTREVIVYTDTSAQELLDRVERGEIQAKNVKKPQNPERDGYWRFLIRCSWDWDNCALSATGGMCYFFEPHDGEKIRCIADLRNLDAEHPNLVSILSDDDVRLIEDRLSTPGL